jgi:hypothetical protein
MEPSNDPDINMEPHLRARYEQVPPVDPAIDAPLGMSPNIRSFSDKSEEDIDHSVWDEPSLRPEIASNPPDEALTYANWLNQRTSSFSAKESWLVTLGVILLSGPCAILLSLFAGVVSSQYQVANVVLVCLVSPLLQEIFKIIIPLWIVEKRPYLFKSWFQFFLCAVASATIFASVTNVMLALPFEEVSRPFFLFMWCGILGMHLITTCIATQGLETIWLNTHNSGKPPKLEHGYPYFITAIGIHVVFAVGCTVYIVAFEIKTLFFS